MESLQPAQAEFAALEDGELAALGRRGAPGAFRAIMQRHNRRLYRVARSVVRDDGEAEDVLQEAYVRAFAAIGEFRGEAGLATWLTRIVLNEAIGRMRRRRPTVALDAIEAEAGASATVIPFPGPAEHDPERAAARREIGFVLERVIDALPAPFRLVFVMRAVEEMSVEETARALDLRPETVKTRLHRARRMLRDALAEQLASALAGAFPFEARRCTRIGDEVLRRMAAIPEPPGPR